MGYSVADTAEKHERILEESIRLFRERGFSGVSVNEVMKAAGLTHGAFYNHFASKEALMAETISQALQKAASELDELPATQSGKARYLDKYLSESHRDTCETGCTFAALSSEVRQVEQVRRPFTEQLKNTVQKFAERFPWSSKRSARGDAIHMLAASMGALILARAVDDKKFSKEILTETRKRLR